MATCVCARTSQDIAPVRCALKHPISLLGWTSAISRAAKSCCSQVTQLPIPNTPGPGYAAPTAGRHIAYRWSMVGPPLRRQTLRRKLRNNHAEALVPMQSQNLTSIYRVGRSANAAPFRDAWAKWRSDLMDPDSVASKVWARFQACGSNISRRGYDV